MPLTWTRHGECNHCGFCCQYSAQTQVVVENPNGIADPAYHRTRGFTLTYVGGVAVKAVALALIQLPPCPKADVQGATTLCRDYEHRPTTCRDFPKTPDQVKGIPCSYWFESPAGDIVGGLASPYPTGVK
jgi:Fe-S-cluster containining protein